MNAAWRAVLADIERVATPAGRATVGSYAIEGTRLHERALAAGVGPHVALMSEEFARSTDPRVKRLRDRLESARCSLHVVASEVVGRLTEGRGSGAIVGLVRLPPRPDLGELLRTAAKPALLLVAVGVEDPGNVGALVRTGLASGVRAFVGIGSCDPFHPKAARTSMGGLFRLPLVLAAAAEPVLEEFGALGATTVGAVSRGGIALPRLSLESEVVAVWVGSESRGLSEEIRGALDCLVTIPMAAPIDSYSVNAAAAVMLYELRRAGFSDPERGLRGKRAVP